MKKDNSKIIIFLLIGIIIGLVIAFTTILIIKNNDNNKTELKTEVEEKEISLEPVEYFQKVDSSNDKGTIKQGFINIVDFLFYDKEIKGKKFSDLKDSAKLKIIEIAYSIDKKIDNYFPGYKETLSNGTKKIYSDIKLKITELYLKVVSKICTNNNQLCIDAKKDFESLKDSFGLTYEFLKNLGIEGFDKLKEWYENFRE